MLLAAGGVIVAFSPSVPIFFAGSVVLLFAVGLFVPTGGVLIMSVLPGCGKSDVARSMSLIVIADQLPRAIGPMIAPVVMALGSLAPLDGYPGLCLAAGVVAVIGGVLARKCAASADQRGSAQHERPSPLLLGRAPDLARRVPEARLPADPHNPGRPITPELRPPPRTARPKPGMAES